MSRIVPSTDRPIPTYEKTLTAEQVSETESKQKTQTAGKALLDGGQVATPQSPPATDAKARQSELQLGGFLREAEMQSLLPTPSAPALDKFPDARSNLDRNIHLDEKIDITKNLPDGKTINSGLAGLDFGPSKSKTGPNHMGVDMTTGGMKAPDDVIADVLNAGKPAKPNAPPPQNNGGTMKTTDRTSGGNSGFGPTKESGGSNSAHPPGVPLSYRAPNRDLISGKELPKWEDKKKEEPKEKSWYEKVVDSVKDTVNDAFGKSKSMTDPDAAGGAGGVPTADDLARAKVRLGQAEHGVNPDLGVGGGAIAPEEMKRPMDLVRDPIGDGESSVETGSPEKAKLAADIHGPRTVNPDLGIDPTPAMGGNQGGPDPNRGNFS